MIGNEFLRFHAVEATPKLDSSASCPTREARCLVEAYRKAGVEIVVTGVVTEPGALAYQVYETWTGAKAFEGVLGTSGVTTSMFEREVGQLVRPVVQRGGLLDGRPSRAAAEITDGSSTPRAGAVGAPKAAAKHWYVLPLVVVGTVVLVAFPILLALLLVGGRQLARRETPRSWKWSGLLVACASGLPILVNAVDVDAAVAKVALRAPSFVAFAPPIVAGALWAAFGLLLGLWLFAPVRGFERVRHDALWPLLRAWLLLTLLRSVALLAVYGPLLALSLRASHDAALSERTIVAFVVPAVGLLLCFVILSFVDNLTLYLDAKLAVWPPTERNPWHATLRRYVQGYVRRGVVEVDEALLARTLFLPGTRGDVVSYGGGFARPRIVVGEKPLEAALGELPDDEELEERKVNPEELPFGLVVPFRRANDDLAELARSERLRTDVTRRPARGRAPVPRLLGENVTLLGWLMPQAKSEGSGGGLPLIANTEEDFGVVKRLLAEHYSAFQGALDDDEVDDSDPTQKDFLFGPLLLELGVIARHDTLVATFRLCLEAMWPGNGIFSRLFRLPIALYDRLLASPGQRVADAYAALNSALHPLIQYLCFMGGADTRLFTARANLPMLVATSRGMVAELEAVSPTVASESPVLANARARARDEARDRVEWVARNFHGSISPTRVRWLRALGSVMIAAAVCIALGRQVSDAIAYHPSYVDRMKSQRTVPSEGDSSR